VSKRTDAIVVWPSGRAASSGKREVPKRGRRFVMNRLMVESGDRITINRQVSVEVVQINPGRVLFEFAGLDGHPVHHVEVERPELPKRTERTVGQNGGHPANPYAMGKPKRNGRTHNGNRSNGRHPVSNGRRQS
jgi:hypothetical protein